MEKRNKEYFTDNHCPHIVRKGIDVHHVSGSVAVLAEISLRSPRKIFILTIKSYIYRIKVSKNRLIKFGKKLHWYPGMCEQKCMSNEPAKPVDCTTGMGAIVLSNLTG